MMYTPYSTNWRPMTTRTFRDEIYITPTKMLAPHIYGPEHLYMDDNSCN